jgi:GntR family transcriptional repressor for pyruvate dehydrogenase complex
MDTRTPHIAGRIPGRIFVPGRSASLSSRIVDEVRAALFDKKFQPGDFLGTEHDLAQHYGVSRIVARDALRTLEALAEALAVQLDLAGVSAAEILDAQRAIECLGAELAAENATAEDIAKLRALVAEAEANMDDVPRYTRLSRDFHLAVAEASHNRVLVVQLISIDHVSWPKRNPTLTPDVAQKVLDVHKDLLKLIETRDAAGARRLMDEHVKMIRARRVSERDRKRKAEAGCC